MIFSENRFPPICRHAFSGSCADALWLAAEPLVLASQSKVRRALLEAAGIPVEGARPHLDERAIEQRRDRRIPARLR